MSKKNTLLGWLNKKRDNTSNSITNSTKKLCTNSASASSVQYEDVENVISASLGASNKPVLKPIDKDNGNVETSSVEVASVKHTADEINIANNSVLSGVPGGDLNVSEYPICWSSEMYFEKIKNYPWLLCKNKSLGCSICRDVNQLGVWKRQGLKISTEWSESKVCAFGSDTKQQAQSLRNKIFKHKNSDTHKTAVKIKDEAKNELLKQANLKQSKTHHVNMSRIFRTVYSITKKGRPFSDLPIDVDLQIFNGLEMGRVQQSDHACANITSHIAQQMKHKIAEVIIKNKSKISILIDESTSIAKRSVLVVCLKAIIPNPDDHMSDPYTFFLDFVELQSTTSAVVVDALLSCLNKYGFNDNYLSNHLICFASDGASNMIGRRSGVSTQLTKMYPNIITWHCANHRLELAVSDVVNEIEGVDHLKLFFNKLYSLYSASPKNLSELRECAAELEFQILSIGRVLSVRWVSSSLRSVKAIWKNYPALHNHFTNAMNDASRSSSDRATFSGLKQRISEVGFLVNLGLLLDALTELSDLSLELQKRSMTLPEAHKLMKRQIRVLESLSENKGHFSNQVEKAVSECSFKGVKLHIGTRVKQINQGQFFRSLAENMRSRLFAFASSHVSAVTDNNQEYENFISNLEVLDSKKWPSTKNMNALHGEQEIGELCKKFRIHERDSIKGFREYLENDKIVPDMLKPLINAVNTLVISTAECERVFSQMNIIHTYSRNSLQINRVSDIVFIKCVGPPLSQFKPDIYATSWLLDGHRDADDKSCMARCRPEEDSEYKGIWQHI